MSDGEADTLAQQDSRAQSQSSGILSHCLVGSYFPVPWMNDCTGIMTLGSILKELKGFWLLLAKKTVLF